MNSLWCRVEIERVTAVPHRSHAGLLTCCAVLLGGGPSGAGEAIHGTSALFYKKTPTPELLHPFHARP